MESLDLFAGPGGWDEGLRPLGIEPLGVEWDDAACATRRAAGHPTLQADVATLDPLEFAGTELLLASPPCQAFSVAGKQKGRLDRDLILAVMHRLALGHDDRAEAAAVAHDPRAMLTVEPLRFALALRPRFIAFEQVPGVLPLWEETATILGVHGYATWTGKVYAEEYGVPQTRRRAILLASLDGPVAPPPPTHHRYDPRAARPVSTDALITWVSMAEALDWPATTPRVLVADATSRATARRLTEPAPTVYGSRGNARWVDAPASSDPLGLKGDDWPWRRPATTIAGDARVFQPGGHHAKGEQSRNAVRVTVEEAAVLQTFPANYPWHGAKNARYLQVGNAVPPLMARAIVGSLVGASVSEEQAA